MAQDKTALGETRRPIKPAGMFRSPRHGGTIEDRPPRLNPRLQIVVDFLDAWRYCPLATSPTPSRQCLEDTAQQLLDALAKSGEG